MLTRSGNGTTARWLAEVSLRRRAGESGPVLNKARVLKQRAPKQRGRGAGNGGLS